MVEVLSTPNEPKNPGCLVRVVQWIQERNRVSDGLLRRIAKQPFRSMIPTCYGAVEVHAYDRIMGALDNGP
jgi:hypothetical protein